MEFEVLIQPHLSVGALQQKRLKGVFAIFEYTPATL